MLTVKFGHWKVNVCGGYTETKTPEYYQENKKLDCLQELCRDPIKSRNVDGYGETIKEESNLRNLFLNEANAHKFQVQPGLEM